MLCPATAQNLKPSSLMPRQISKLLKRFVVSARCEPSVYLARSHVRNLAVFGAANYLKMALLSKQSAKLVAHVWRLEKQLALPRHHWNFVRSSKVLT
jgi:hypothetical protein